MEATSLGPAVALGPGHLSGDRQVLNSRNLRPALVLVRFPLAPTLQEETPTGSLALALAQQQRGTGDVDREAIQAMVQAGGTSSAGRELVPSDVGHVGESQPVQTEASAYGSEATARGVGLETEFELIRMRDRLEKIEEGKTGSFGSASSGRLGWVDHQALSRELARQAEVRESEAQKNGVWTFRVWKPIAVSIPTWTWGLIGLWIVSPCTTAASAHLLAAAIQAVGAIHAEGILQASGIAEALQVPGKVRFQVSFCHKTCEFCKNGSVTWPGEFEPGDRTFWDLPSWGQFKNQMQQFGHRIGCIEAL